MPRVLRNLVSAAACGAVLMLMSTVPAAALVNPTTGHNGAPNNTCGSPGITVTPGNAVNARGSAFNPNGIAGLHYAGNPNTSSLAHSNSTASVAQYDTACVRLSGK